MEKFDAASEAKKDFLVQSKIDDFFDHFRIGTLLHRCGIRKRHGYSVRSLIQTIFMLPFLGKNFFRGIVINNNYEVGKDAAYDILKSCTYNWRQVLLTLGVRLYCLFNRLTSDQRHSVLIIDDSTYDRSRSKKVELLSRVFDHSNGPPFKRIPVVDAELVGRRELFASRFRPAVLNRPEKTLL